MSVRRFRRSLFWAWWYVCVEGGRERSFWGDVYPAFHRYSNEYLQPGGCVGVARRGVDGPASIASSTSSDVITRYRHVTNKARTRRRKTGGDIRAASSSRAAECIYIHACTQRYTIVASCSQPGPFGNVQSHTHTHTHTHTPSCRMLPAHMSLDNAASRKALATNGA